MPAVVSQCGNGEAIQPSHSMGQMAAKAIKSLSGVKKHIEIQSYARQDQEVDIVAPESKS